MIVSLFLCLYLLVLVIDMAIWGVWVGYEGLIRSAWFHLALFLGGIVVFRDELAAFAEKEQTRIVFNPRVYGCFALACGVCVAALVTHDSFAIFAAWGVLLGLLMFWGGGWILNLFPIHTRQTQRLVGWTTVAGIGAFCVLVFNSLSGLSFETIQIQSNTAQQEIEKPIQERQGTGATSGVTIDDLVADANGLSGAMTNTGIGSSTGTGVVKEEVLSGTQVEVLLQENQPLTYRILLPYLDAQGLLPAVREKPTFTEISPESELYGPFQRARGLKMIGTNINPDRQVRCENLMVVLGLANKRKIDSSRSLLDAYRAAAAANNALQSCVSRTQIATQDVLK